MQRLIPKMGQLIKNKDIWDEEFGELIIDRELTQRLSKRNRGGVRISGGLYYTEKEYEERRKKVLEKTLP